MKRYASLFAMSTLALVALVPSLAHAEINCGAVGPAIVGVESLLCNFGEIVDVSTSIAAALALLVFFWGLVKYIAKADDEKAKESGKNIMIWGVVALFVMFSVFGLVNFLQESFGTTEDTIRPPQL